MGFEGTQIWMPMDTTVSIIAVTADLVGARMFTVFRLSEESLTTAETQVFVINCAHEVRLVPSHPLVKEKCTNDKDNSRQDYGSFKISVIKAGHATSKVLEAQ